MLVTRPLSNILVLVELSLGIMYLKTTKHNFPYQMKIRKGGGEEGTGTAENLLELT